MAEQLLAGKAILVVEDEYYAADDLRRALLRLGAQVIGPAPTLDRALDLIEVAQRIDAAILDINLGGEMTFPVADILKERGVPFLFATGYDASAIPSRFGEIVRCEKPIGPDKVETALRGLVWSEVP